MRSKSKLKILDQLAVTKPCAAEDFEAISEPRGNGWFCHHCEKQVHDFSKLSKKEILALVETSGGHFCASIQRRPNGSIITKEPPASSLFYGGVLLAGTSLFASSALAEPPAKPGEVFVTDRSIVPETHLRGDVAVPVATPSPDCADPAGADKPPVETSTPNPNQQGSDIAPNHPSRVELGMVAVEPPKHTRGKVAIQKK